MNYQEAKKIREKSYISYLTEKLSEGRGVGSAIKATLSEKSQAKSIGYKEKFDPMNIVKFMTGGSKFATALYGSMRGRSPEDIQYFTGTKKTKDVKDTATKIGQLDSDDAVMDVLSKIYMLLKTTNENNIKRKEKENNLKEEQELEKEKRHKALIAAITGKKQTTAAPTAVKDSGEGLFGTIMSLVTGLIGTAIAAAIKPIMELISGITSMIGEILKKLGLKAAETVFDAARKIGALAGAAGAAGAVIGTVAVGGVAASIAATSILASEAGRPLREAFKDENDRSGMLGAMAGDTAVAASILNNSEQTEENAIRQKRMNILKDRPSNKKSLLFWKDPQLAAEYLKDIGWDEKTGTTKKERESGVIGIDKKGNPIMKPIPAETPKNEAPTTAPSTENPTAQPVSKQSSKLDTVTSENLDLNMQSTPESVTTAQMINNMNVNSTSEQRPKGPIPSVRNMEDSFQRMLLHSLRVV